MIYPKSLLQLASLYSNSLQDELRNAIVSFWINVLLPTNKSAPTNTDADGCTNISLLITLVDNLPAYLIPSTVGSNWDVVEGTPFAVAADGNK